MPTMPSITRRMGSNANPFRKLGDDGVPLPSSQTGSNLPYQDVATSHHPILGSGVLQHGYLSQEDGGSTFNAGYGGRPSIVSSWRGYLPLQRTDISINNAASTSASSAVNDTNESCSEIGHSGYQYQCDNASFEGAPSVAAPSVSGAGKMTTKKGALYPLAASAPIIRFDEIGVETDGPPACTGSLQHQQQKKSNSGSSSRRKNPTRK
jgi:hypothetical protein